MQTQFAANEAELFLPFDTPQIVHALRRMSKDDVDGLPYGVIGFDRATTVRIYSRTEEREAGLDAARVVGRAVFAEIAPCMNNYLVAQRFEDAWASDTALDATIDYVLTLRMRPVRVALRLVAHPESDHAYILVRRRVGR